MTKLQIRKIKRETTHSLNQQKQTMITRNINHQARVNHAMLTAQSGIPLVKLWFHRHSFFPQIPNTNCYDHVTNVSSCQPICQVNYGRKRKFALSEFHVVMIFVPNFLHFIAILFYSSSPNKHPHLLESSSASDYCIKVSS